MKLTEFTFFKNTPLIDFQNTIFFPSNQARDDFFLNGNHYEKITFTQPFNFIRDRYTIHLKYDYSKFQGVNYCTFISQYEPNIRYYCFVISYEYVNDEVIKVDMLVDGIMTFCQGDTIYNFKNLTVTRKHMSRKEYNERIKELQNNDDVIKTFTKRYTHHNSYKFKEFDILIQSSASFTADFGTVDDPKVESSEGLEFDKISSPLNIYVVKQKDFRKLMETLSPYPWISQNIRSVTMIPSVLLEGKTRKVTMKTGNFNELYTLIDGEKTSNYTLEHRLLELSKTTRELCQIFNLDYDEDRHLLRNEYTTTELYTYDGEQLFIDNGLLSDSLGLHLRGAYVSGFHNEIAIFIDGYKAKDNMDVHGGSFLNDAIFFKNFDDIPIMIDNFNLSMAKTANQRKLAESQLISNRIANVMDSTANTQDRFYDAAALISNISPVALFGKFNDEHDFYKRQQAEFKDMALTTNTVTNSSTNNSMGIAENFYGIHVKHAQPIKSEWEKIKKYYKLFGYEVNDENTSVNPMTMTICDYLQFTGNFIIENADVGIVEMIKSQFENGVRLWHNNDTPNPMTQNVLNNKMR